MKNLWTKNNRVKILSTAEDYFSAIESGIDHAQSRVVLITYIYKMDAIGDRITNALKRAALRGLSVSLVVDGVGSMDLPKSFLAFLEDCGIEVHVFRPFSKIFHLRGIFWRRLHQKIVLIDDTTALVGGMNIDQEQLRQLDFSALVQGPVVARIEKVVNLSLARLRRDWVEFFLIRKRQRRRYFKTIGPTKAAFVIRDNLRYRHQIEKIYLDQIRSSRERILIANAYFFPGFRFRKALVDAAQRGADITLVLPGPTDHPIVRNASMVFYREFLRAGIKIIEYQRQMLHAKVAVIDGHWLTIGSCNLDLFSLFLSLEANIVADDEKLAIELEDQINLALRSGSKKIEIESLPERNILNWLLAWLSFLVLRLLRAISGA